MKTWSYKQTTRLALSLLLTSLLLSGVQWIHKEQWHFTLDRQLIEALKKGDTKQAIALLEMGANPNSRFDPTPAPSLSDLLQSFLHHSHPPANNSITALMLACGANSYEINEQKFYPTIEMNDPLLTHVMLLHGANVDIKSAGDCTALYFAVEWQRSKVIIKQLLDHGADPTHADDRGKTPIDLAEQSCRSDLVALLRKYRKHP